MPRRFKSTMHGLLVVDKPVGPSSMAVVRRVRRAAGMCKTGHGGTLDPLASGILVCALGKATKLVEDLMDHDKVYETSIDLSAFTTTDDAEGERLPAPTEQPPSRAAIDDALASLTGTIMQRPPAYSACKVQGKAAYARARAGEQVELPARPVRIDAIQLRSYVWPELQLSVQCGRGTYIRSLARQIGEALGCGGHLTALRRCRVGDFDLHRAIPLDRLPERIEQADLIVPEGLGIPD
ncbi:MAG: tRNA pseudouridine(55) synthase TruB [Planctomycetota bacterium]